MGVITSYLVTSISDAAIPHLRAPVEGVFDGVVTNKGLPDRDDLRSLRNRVDMLDYHVREVNKQMNTLRARLKSVLEDVAEAERLIGEGRGD